MGLLAALVQWNLGALTPHSALLLDINLKVTPAIDRLQEKASLMSSLPVDKVTEIMTLMAPSEAVAMLAAMTDASMTMVTDALSSEERERLVKVSRGPLLLIEASWSLPEAAVWGPADASLFAMHQLVISLLRSCCQMFDCGAPH
jgi:hypothetical protein